MEAFKVYLEGEGLLTNEIDYEEIVIKTIPTVDLEVPKLYLPKVDLLRSKNVELWQDITVSLLRGYIDYIYKKAKAREEQKHSRAWCRIGYISVQYLSFAETRQPIVFCR